MPERRHGAALEQALLDAAWDELLSGGYARFTMDAVVKRAGTSPPVLYRRWSDRDALVRATLVHVLRKNVLKVPDTGSLREDVLAILRDINTNRVQLMTVMSVYLASYHLETGTSPAELLDPADTDRKQAVDAIYDRAVERGEAGAERLTDRIKALPFDLLRHEILTTYAPASEQVLEEIVDTMFLPLVR
ncbi:TetR/AcrR family transcriptional regulator [Catenulispora sp. NF23]|uniref:TetR/AcrR family transcriptional regulator n=1 Tax=Catenulispora pinistramenti TaxID=2705254 RepID=A0ABS5KU00_9ACTN|nr:TetR/AcrR family transcriptional regulator [Catenulispora pinistramenti]MBS2534018.1 TetR/AcrR family transcriptional regulator [Catenulispora pinistramenti]MBS2549527.1 TetR/AcrR family transcriptional regulator [Catenulispora pinistramenti]